MTRRRKGFTLWFTGLPCSGKSTLARLVERELARRGHGIEVLDGDEVRRHLTRGLGFSKADRDENIRRIGYVCRLLSRNGAVAIAAAISPYRAARDEVRAAISADAFFVEAYVNARLETCIKRDLKGMYKKAMAGEIPNFTGISDPYEPPLRPEIEVTTDAEPAEISGRFVVAGLERLGLVAPVSQPVSDMEKAEIKARLARLGYL